MLKPISRGVLSVALLLGLHAAHGGIPPSSQPSLIQAVQPPSGGLRLQAEKALPRVSAAWSGAEAASRPAAATLVEDYPSGWALFSALWGMVLSGVGVVLWLNRMPARRR